MVDTLLYRLSHEICNFFSNFFILKDTRPFFLSFFLNFQSNNPIKINRNVRNIFFLNASIAAQVIHKCFESSFL